MFRIRIKEALPIDERLTLSSWTTIRMTCNSLKNITFLRRFGVFDQSQTHKSKGQSSSFRIHHQILESRAAHHLYQVNTHLLSSS